MSRTAKNSQFPITTVYPIPPAAHFSKLRSEKINSLLKFIFNIEVNNIFNVKNHIMLIVCIMIMLISGVFNSTTYSNDKKGILQGIVVNGYDYGTISDVKVTLMSEDKTYELSTGYHGNFEFRNIPYGNCSLILTCSGYARKIVVFSNDGYRGRFITIQMLPLNIGSDSFETPAVKDRIFDLPSFR